MRGRVVLAVAGTTVGAFTLHVAPTDRGFTFVAEHPGSRALLLVAGLAPIASGVWTFSARPAPRRVGVLLVLVGCTWFIGTWDDPGVDSDVAFTLGLVASASCVAVVAHLLFAYPTGRLNSTGDGAFVVAGYVAAVGVLGVLASAFYDPASAGCTGCPANLGLLSDQPATSLRASTDGVLLVFGWTVAASAWALCRLLRSSPARRRTAAPVVMPALAFLALTALAFGATLGRPYLSESALQRRLWEAHGMVLVALAVGAARALVTARSRRRELTRLVVDLDRSAAAGGMQHVLAQILGDADLRIGYPLTEGGHADSAGHLLQTVPTDGRATTVLTRAGREVAVLVHRVGVLDDPGLVDELASAGSLGLDHERLRAQTRRQLADVRASRARIVAAGDEERRRLERDLHDGAQQRLVGLALTARAMRHHIDDAGEDSLARAEERIRLALDELRDLARGLYPVVLVEEGLAVALDALAESAPLGIRTAPAGRFSAEVETTAYLAIAAATATGPTAVSVKASDDCLTVDLVSRGHPDLQDVPDRVDALAGQLTLEPTTPGTRIVVQLPLGVPTSGS